MRACENQVVIDEEICCREDNKPCIDGIPSKTDPKLLIGCGDCNPPEDGTIWRGCI